MVRTNPPYIKAWRTRTQREGESPSFFLSQSGSAHCHLRPSIHLLRSLCDEIVAAIENLLIGFPYRLESYKTASGNRERVRGGLMEGCCIFKCVSQAS